MQYRDRRPLSGIALCLRESAIQAQFVATVPVTAGYRSWVIANIRTAPGCRHLAHDCRRGLAKREVLRLQQWRLDEADKRRRSYALIDDQRRGTSAAYHLAPMARYPDDRKRPDPAFMANRGISL